jgi:Arc/MetJ-type ribon-helix-helix transcriptional regulator
MTVRTQITVRIDEALVSEMDQAVQAGTVSSRATYVEAALRRQHRQRLIDHEIAVLSALNGSEPYPELAGMHNDFQYPDVDA